MEEEEPAIGPRTAHRMVNSILSPLQMSRPSSEQRTKTTSEPIPRQLLCEIALDLGRPRFEANSRR